MLVNVTVTQEHIENGIRQDCFKCPLALALQPFFLDGFEVQVGIVNMRIIDIFTWVCHRINHTVKIFQFINQVDDFKDVKPQTFQIDIPWEYMKHAMARKHACSG